MLKASNLQLSQILEDKKPQTILPFVKNIFTDYYKNGEFKIVVKAFFKVKDIFEGKFLNYGRCDTPYHDYNHTIDVFLATARILDGYLLKTPDVPVGLITNCLLAALLHDVGYIMKEDDNEGTGAKYTVIHVERGIAFLAKHHDAFGVGQERLASIGRMIKATQVAHNFDNIKFVDEKEKTMCAILASADLVGQMSNRDYLERLVLLYFEFKEANLPGYNTEFDILSRTHTFYEVTKKQLKETLMDVAAYARYHFSLRNGLDKDLYQESIAGQMEYLEKVIKDETTNFRNKLHRADWPEEQPV